MSYRIMKAIRLPGTLRELLMIIRRFSVWKAKTGGQPLLAREWPGGWNRFLEGATGGNGIDHPGCGISYNERPAVDGVYSQPRFQPLAAPGACFGG